MMVGVMRRLTISSRPNSFGTVPCRREFDVRQTESQYDSCGLGYAFDFGGDGDL